MRALLAGLAARLASFPLPPWRTPDSIANADAGAMMEAIEEGSDDNEVVIAERDGVPVGCLHILVMKDFFGVSHGHISVLATTVEAEGTGVGRTLIDYAEQWTTAARPVADDAERVRGERTGPAVLRSRRVRSRDAEVREANLKTYLRWTDWTAKDR